MAVPLIVNVYISFKLFYQYHLQEFGVERLRVAYYMKKIDFTYQKL